VIKFDIEFIKYELKQKIFRDEFAFLEKRASMLEGRQFNIKIKICLKNRFLSGFLFLRYSPF